jgi:hypothetical protein
MNPLQSVSEYIDGLIAEREKAKADLRAAFIEMEKLRATIRDLERQASEARKDHALVLGRQATDSKRDLEAERQRTIFAAGYGKELCTLLGRCLPWVALHGDDRKAWARDVAKILELSGHA